MNRLNGARAEMWKWKWKTKKNAYIKNISYNGKNHAIMGMCFSNSYFRHWKWQKHLSTAFSVQWKLLERTMIKQDNWMAGNEKRTWKNMFFKSQQHHQGLPFKTRQHSIAISHFCVYSIVTFIYLSIDFTQKLIAFDWIVQLKTIQCACQHIKSV